MSTCFSEWVARLFGVVRRYSGIFHLAQSVEFIVCIMRDLLLHFSRVGNYRIPWSYSRSAWYQLFGDTEVSSLSNFFGHLLKLIHFRKINIGIRFLPRREIPLPRLDLSGLQLIFEAARQVQMLITLCADCLEKLRALFVSHLIL
jgi:hypothetical protein